MNASKTLLIALMPVILAACSTNTADNKIVTVDLATNLLCADTGSAEEIFQVKSMLHPAVTDSTMMSFPEFCGTDGDRLYLMQRSMSGTRLMLFDSRSGKCLSSFDHTGNGPGEYGDMLSVYRNPESDLWTVYDSRAQKILNYTTAGEFIDAIDFSTTRSITPLGKGWVGENKRKDDAYKVFYRFGNRMELIDSIVSPVKWHITREGVSSVSRLQPAGNTVYWHENDTLYTIPSKGNMSPQVAFNLGQYKMPKFESYETERAERGKYLTYFAFATDDAVLVYYMHDERCTGQVYSKADGTLRYSITTPMEESVGFPLVVDGTTYHGFPSELTHDGSVLFLVMADEMAAITGDDETNPAIIRASVSL